MPLDNAFALDAIANLLDGSMWTPEHLDQIADLVRQTGRAIGSPDEPRVRQPLPGELSPELRAALRMVDAQYALSPDEIEDLVCRRDWIDADFEEVTGRCEECGGPFGVHTPGEGCPGEDEDRHQDEENER